MRLIINSIALGANVHKNFLPTVRIMTALTAVGYISYTLFHLGETEFTLWKSSFELNGDSLFFLLLVCILVFLNWGFEVVKWKLLSSKIELLSWCKTIHSVFYGISLGMITPKRTGEFAGRVWMLKPSNRFSGLLLNTAGSLSQLFITFLMGSIALSILYPLFNNNTDAFSAGMPAWFLVFGTAFAFLIIVSVFALPIIARSAKTGQNSFSRKTASWLRVFSLLSSKDMTGLLLLSFLRYWVFATQFYLLLRVFGLQLPFFTAINLIAIIYLFMTLVPLSAIWELAVRGSVAMLVFGIYLSHIGQPFQQASVLAATTVLWIINLALPAIAGGILGLNSELKKSKPTCNG